MLRIFYSIENKKCIFVMKILAEISIYTLTPLPKESGENILKF